MRLEPLSIAAAPALLAMMRLMQIDDPWSVPFDEARALAAVELMLRNPNFGLAWFLEHDGRHIGYIVLSWDYSLEYGGRNAWVDEFFIFSEFRGKGFGAQALELFEQEALAAGATAIHLGVNPGNPAEHLYRRSGFVGHQRYLMTKFLS
ncbi:GCN5-related N-acetyltransferase [Candidatus Koribacter versatilis Ellin345]|uniref:GCN5-related N-acetyltransferase n=1 Tax=Koribacter versatilis (strain Ellin345) TaxID=204669 RepID=Q1IJ55_KORVE|nr:GNAT family N-acetyltransferase [Candidatus Koribacter versatilis]ABF43095.1 GCN5-related N-acetyltransferase [Candidatus Koribacter versatilis Ellin345]